MYTEADFRLFRAAFDVRNDEVDITFRAVNTGDEEESRLVDRYRSDGQAYIDTFPEAVRADLKPMIETICLSYDRPRGEPRQVSVEEFHTTMDKIAKLLEPFISNGVLFAKDPSAWEDALFDDTWEDFNDSQIERAEGDKADVGTKADAVAKAVVAFHCALIDVCDDRASGGAVDEMDGLMDKLITDVEKVFDVKVRDQCNELAVDLSR